MGRVTRGQGIVAIVFGVLEIIMGIVIMICSFVVAARIKFFSYAPYWTGFVYIIPGILGIIAGAKKNIGCMIASMVFNILDSIMLGVMCVVYGNIMVDSLPKKISWYCDDSFWRSSFYWTDRCENLTSLQGIMWAIFVNLLLSAILTFVSSILGCMSVCCTPAERIGVVAQPVAMGVLAQPLQYQQAMGVVQPLQYQPAMGVLAEQPQYQPGMVVSAQPPQYQPPPAYQQPLSLTQVKD